MFTGNKFFDSPDIEIRESDYDGNGTLYVKDSKNGFTEVSLDVLTNRYIFTDGNAAKYNTNFY